jgi:LacI family repressor for deo operon, udp, cdd, tsx, nupC, and nupG
MNRRGATIRQVAAAAGVSVATVSRAIENPKIVAPETQSRVQRAIQELGYVPNAQSQILRTSRTRLVVALVPDIANPFFSEVIRGIEQVANANRYSVLLGDTQYDSAREQGYISMIAARQADGVVSLVPRIPKELAQSQSRFPFVNACEYVPDANVTSLYVDNVAGAMKATSHLITLGHRRIAHIRGPMTSQICVDRQKGYEQALRRARISVNKSLISAGDFTVESGIRATGELLSRGEELTAIFCANDDMAFGAMQALRARKLDVPTDVSVVGFDDIRYSRHFHPALTTVAQPKFELGRSAMAALLEIFADANALPYKRVFATELVVRDSTGPWREIIGPKPVRKSV